MMDPKSRVIVASPDPFFRHEMVDMLSVLRWPAEEAVGGADALNRMDGRTDLEAIVLDHWLPDLNVPDLEHSLRARFPALDVLTVDLKAEEPDHMHRAPVYPRTREFSWALRKRQGRSRPIIKENRPTSPANSIHQQYGHLENSIDEPQDEMYEATSFAALPGVVGSDARLNQVARLVHLVAKRNSSVIITGETGTGKEVIAKGLHALSSRADRPLIIVNCAAIPEALLESELFGHSRGAFTGAVQPRIGRIQAADGGTLFLDEIGELAPSLQAKLLRFLQEGEIQRLGSNEIIKVDARVISATNANLTEAGGNRLFRPDLYYRLAVFPIELPPLRHRGKDVLLLASHFLSDMCAREKTAPKQISDAVRDRLLKHSWPGNIRELQHVIERAFILSENKDVLTLKHLPSLIFTPLSQNSFNFV